MIRQQYCGESFKYRSVLYVRKSVIYYEVSKRIRQDAKKSGALLFLLTQPPLRKKVSPSHVM